MARILFVVTHPMTAFHLLRGQLGALRAAGFEVAVACAPGAQLEAVAAREGVAVFPVPLEREISPLADLHSLLALHRVMRHFRPDLVNASTPKGGLLGTLAAWLARVPHRVYTVRGLRLETTTGFKRRLFTWTERLAASAAGRVVCVSPSLERRVRELGLASAAKTTVLGGGSSNGVDVERFHPAALGARQARRRALGIPLDAPVVGFVGRLTRDKGLPELATAFDEHILPRLPEARLLLLGDFEDGDPVPPDVRARLEEHPRVVRVGFVDDTAPFYAAMDVMAFPSHREGFPNTPLEAAASAVPVVGYNATGTVDAVVDGETGRLVPVGDARALGVALAELFADGASRRRLGAAARLRVEREFRREVVWRAWIDEYERLLAS